MVKNSSHTSRTFRVVMTHNYRQDQTFPRSGWGHAYRTYIDEWILVGSFGKYEGILGVSLCAAFLKFSTNLQSAN